MKYTNVSFLHRNLMPCAVAIVDHLNCLEVEWLPSHGLPTAITHSLIARQACELERASTGGRIHSVSFGKAEVPGHSRLGSKASATCLGLTFSALA